jgi:hypothetical protein
MRHCRDHPSQRAIDVLEIFLLIRRVGQVSWRVRRRDIDERVIFTDTKLYHPASFDGKVLQLHYAREQKLAPYLDMVAAQGPTRTCCGGDERIPTRL